MLLKLLDILGSKDLIPKSAIAEKKLRCNPPDRVEKLAQGLGFGIWGLGFGV